MKLFNYACGKFKVFGRLRRGSIVTIILLAVLVFTFMLIPFPFVLPQGNTMVAEGPYIGITVDPENQSRYGFVYPLTYVFSIPSNASDLKVWFRYDQVEPWIRLQEKTSDDLFNGIYAVRFDYTNEMAYVSIGFNGTSNIIQMRFTDSANTTVYDIDHLGFAEYYDNRKCVVTATIDEWDDVRSNSMMRAVDLFQERQMWVSASITTYGVASLGEGFNATTWMEIQSEVDEGYVEPTSHSRTHANIPYSNTTWEVRGSRDDIIGNMTYIPYSWGSNKYVYAWIEPYGTWNNATRTEVGQADYIVDREYYYTSDVSWGDYNASYRIYSASHYPDPGGRWDEPWGAINSKFDQAYNNGQIYHGMFHPLVIDEARWQNITDHLDYISGRKDVWYVGFGHLYMYHYLQEFSSELLSVDTVGFITHTSDSDFLQGTSSENVGIVNGSLRLKLLGGGLGSFGKTDIGESTFVAADDTMFGCKYGLPQASDVENITVYLTGPTGNFRVTGCAIYSDNNGVPSTLLGSTETAWPSSGWTTFSFASPLSLSSGQYWIFFYIMLYDETGYYSPGNPNQAVQYYRRYDGTWPSQFPTPAAFTDRAISMYANFTKTGGGNGSWTSEWLDASQIVNWTKVSWSEATPPGTDLVISTRTCPELFEGYPYESQASPWSSNLTDPTGSPVASPNNRFLQYKVYLLTNGTYTPILYSAAVFYENSNTTQQYATLTVDSIPVNGQCFVNSIPLGITPQTKNVVPGTYMIGWGDVDGYYTPASQNITLAENETATVVGIYEEIPPPPAHYQLSIYSTPINGFTVEISNSTHTFQMNTGSSMVLMEGEYNITVVDTMIEITFEQWIFNAWSDGATSASRSIILSKNTILAYEYTRQ